MTVDWIVGWTGEVKMTGVVRQAEEDCDYDDSDDEEQPKVVNMMKIVKNLSSSAMYPPLPTTQSM